MGKPDVITASFATNLTNLRDKIGDDTINNLGSAVVSWLPNDVFNRLQSISNISTTSGVNLKYFVPLASTNRVFQYDDVTGSTVLDNIFYKSSSSPTSNKVLKGEEFRPAITFSTIVDLIKEKYNLQIIAPLESRNEYTDLYTWCMGNSFGDNSDKEFIILTSAYGSATGSFVDINSTTNTVKVKKLSGGLFTKKFFKQRIRLEGLLYFGVNTTVTMKIVKVGELTPIITQTFDISLTDENLVVQIPDAFLDGSREIEYKTYLQFSNPVMWTNSEIQVRLLSDIISDLVVQRTTNNNFIQMGGSKIDLIKALPEIKVIDFLSSYLKSFNIAILDVTPDNDSLYFYTPQDILDNKKEQTYTADISTVDKSNQDDFNYYIFQHAESAFRSNSDYKIGAGVDYGKTQFPAVKPADAKEYKIETNFTIIPPVTVEGTDDIYTMYGFDNGTPEILGTGEARYTPNFGELVLFYSHGNKTLGRQFAVQNNVTGGALITSSMSSYIKVMPFTSDLKSFSWSVLVDRITQIPNSLYSRYYATLISRLIDQNVMKQEFSLTLTPEQVRNFRLENDIIISENKFSNIDATIDIAQLYLHFNNRIYYSFKRDKRPIKITGLLVDTKKRLHFILK